MNELRKKLCPILLVCMAACLALAVILMGTARRGLAAEQIVLSKPALELEIGVSEQVTAEGGGEITWSSDDESVATVRGNGIIEAVGAGETTVRAKSASGEGSVRVYAVEKKKSINDNILISVFWPPTLEYMGNDDAKWDEQFKLLADADVDYLNNVTGRDRQRNPDPALIGENSKETNLKMAEYAHRYGMLYGVADERMRNLLSMSEEEIVSLISEYRNIPGVGGYYIKDEPGPAENLTVYSEIYGAIKSADPNAYAYFNFLPMWAYVANDWQRSEEPYREAIDRWMTETNALGYPTDYVLYDFYPYGSGREMRRDEFFANLEVVRDMGLQGDYKTGTYLQSIGGSGRSPSPSEIRYEAMCALAFGFKQLSYFTWFLPTNRTENFFASIVDDKGQPNPKTYEAICRLNAEIHNLGKTLIRLDSLEVYQNYQQWGKQDPLPGDFVARSNGSDAEYTVSRMQDRKTGRQYLMYVNNDFTDPTSFTVYFEPGIRSVERVSPEDGSLVKVAVGEDGAFTIELAAGDGILLALPEDYGKEKDTSAAQEMLARVEEERPSLEAAHADTSALDAAVAALENAMTAGTQEEIDQCTENVRKALEALLAAQEPEPEPEPGDEGGCGGVIGAGGGAMMGIALLGGALALRKRKRE